MLTPHFTCSQTNESVIIKVYCPSVRAKDAEIIVDGTQFTLHLNPYFLRLNFPHPVVEDDASSASYDPSSGYFTASVSKETRGQDFQDLDLLAKLLAPPPLSSDLVSPVEVLSSTDTLGHNIFDKSDEDSLVSEIKYLDLNQEHQEILHAAANDWHLPQEPATSSIELTEQKHYGFLGLRSGYFRHVHHTANEINELGADAETCSIQERRTRRLRHEEDKWDPDYYMSADFMDDGQIQDLLSWKHPHVVDDKPFEYTEQENATMLCLPRREYLTTPAQTRGLYLTLISILFSYAYESRTTQCDPTPESAWTLSNLIPSFSALDPPTSPARESKEENHSSSASGFPDNAVTFTNNELTAALIPSYRRALAFPLYRSFALAEACQRDVACLFAKGRRTVVRCLLEMKHILDHHEVYYVYNKIWVDDFCVWTQAYASDAVLVTLARTLTKLKVEKGLIGWDLEELEATTMEVAERESDSDDE